MVATTLARLFPATADIGSDAQARAAAAAMRNRLTVISGGPGTGKTTTVVRILALLRSGNLSLTRNVRLACSSASGCILLRERERAGPSGRGC